MRFTAVLVIACCPTGLYSAPIHASFKSFLDTSPFGGPGLETLTFDFSFDPEWQFSENIGGTNGNSARYHLGLPGTELESTRGTVAWIKPGNPAMARAAVSKSLAHFGSIEVVPSNR